MNFLRSHDELDLGRLTDTQRERVFQAFATLDLLSDRLGARPARPLPHPRGARLGDGFIFADLLPSTTDSARAG